MPRASRPPVLIACACLVPAFLDALQAYLRQRLLGARTVDWNNVAFAGGEWLFLGALTPITYVLARRFPLRRDRIGRTLAAHAVGALLLSAAWATAGIAMRTALGMDGGRGSLGRNLAGWMLTTLPYGVFMYFAVLGCVYAFTYFLEAREREAQQARLAAQLADSKLGALRMQLNPHFLFNALNAITVLVRDQNTRDASRMLELLGGLLRRVLHADKRPSVPLTDEIGFLERYLAIEEVRFSDRLTVRWAIDAAVRDALVPEFILQPLVENAIRHGLAKRSDAGVIAVGAHGEGGDLVLTVTDDGPGYDPSPESAGVGLANTRARLHTLFGDAGRLDISRGPRGGTVATIHFPFSAASDA